MKKLRSLILFTILVLAAMLNYQRILELLGKGIAMAAPFLLGGAIAFILNVPMRKIERDIMPKKAGRWKRGVSLLLALILIISILVVVVFVVTPELIATLWNLQNSIPVFVNNVLENMEQLFVQYPEIVTYIEGIQIDWESIFRSIMDFISIGASSVVSTTVSAAKSIVSGFTTLSIGFVFAVYILLQKESLSAQIKKLLRAFFPDPVVGQVLRVTSMTERTFSSFLAGQCLEAVILGSMFFITLTLLRMPYALLIGVLIGFTALIPIFGAFIGCVIGAFLMLMVSPLSALSFVVIFFVLQQIEGNLIYPHVVGGSVGLPSIWVLVAVTIGGSMVGIIGMLIFIPTCSVLYNLLREYVNKRITQKEAHKKSVKKES